MAEAVLKLKTNTLTRLELDDLSSHFFPLARNIARRFSPRGKEDDFVSAGYHGIAYALVNAALKMFDDDLESWVKSCIYRFVRRQLVTDHMVCIPNTTLREARARGEDIQLLKGHPIGAQCYSSNKRESNRDVLEALERATIDPTDKEIMELRVEGFVDQEIAEIIGISRTEIQRRRTRIESRFNKSMEKE
jgi:RNA polymerase sigma factor (sigma-70 family)